MLTYQQKQRLTNNWGEKSLSLSCPAEVRIYDPLSSWECFIYSINPEDEDEIECIISGGKNVEPMVTNWRLKELKLLYNSDGEGVQLDAEYRPRQALEVYNKLNERYR